MVMDLTSIQPGSEVLMHFTIRLEDGTVADSSRDDGPLRFRLGDGTLIEGLELALLGLRPGDVQRLKLAPQHAYGHAEAANIQPLDRAEFPADIDIKRGVIIGFATPEAGEIPGMIVDVDDQRILVDFNHPLAGHEIDFEVEILEVTGNLAPPVMQ